MRIAIVGPTHPAKGGISQHSTLLSHHLAGAGDDVVLCSWASQYPKFLYPGEVAIPGERPEFELFPSTTRKLRWWWPFGWLAAGRAHRKADAVVLVFVTPVQVPAFLGILAGLGRLLRRSSSRPGKPRVLVVCHNVVPHEGRSFDRVLTSMLLHRVDGVLTHTDVLAAEAATFTAAPVRVSKLPPFGPDTPVRRAPGAPARHHVLFFGFVRPYKGVDVLVRAIAKVPELTATIVGEFWSDPEELRSLATELGVADRVDVRAEYVAAGAIPGYFEAADALVLPYRSGTASANVDRAHGYGLPVVATRVGSFEADVRDGIDGLLCAPDDPDALARALEHLYEPGVLTRLERGIEAPDIAGAWAGYVDVLRDLASEPRSS